MILCIVMIIIIHLVTHAVWIYMYHVCVYIMCVCTDPLPKYEHGNSQLINAAFSM